MRHVAPSDISSCVRFGFNPWFVKLRLGELDAPEKYRKFLDRMAGSSTLPTRLGDKFEKEVYDEIRNNTGINVVEGSEVETVERCLRDKDLPMAIFQAPLEGEIEGFSLKGDSDVVLAWAGDSGVNIRVVDIKGTWEEEMYHRVQVGIYSLLLRQELDQLEYGNLSGAIYTREDSKDALLQDDWGFSLQSIETDVSSILSSTGPIQSSLDVPVDEISTDIQSSQSMPYAELLNLYAFENKDLGLLGLSPRQQRILANHGIEDVEDVASLYEVPENPKPYSTKTLDPRERDTVDNIREDGFRGTLPHISQEAQDMLRQIEPESETASDVWWSQWKKGVGVPEIPEDEPNLGTTDFPEGGMVRVYLNVQYDYIRDRIYSVGCSVDSTLYSGDTYTTGECVLSVDQEEYDREEKRILTSVLEDVVDASELIASMTGQGDSFPVHVYLYSEHERECLEEALKRHSEDSYCRMFRELLSGRDAIDQQFVSVLEPEIDRCLTRRQPSNGILQVLNSRPRSRVDWDVDEVNLKNLFHTGLFDYFAQVSRDGDRVSFVHNDGEDSIPAFPQVGSSVPLEYLWGCKEIDEFSPDWTDDSEERKRIERYRYGKNGQRIHAGHIAALSTKLSTALLKIERSLSYRDESIDKQPIELRDFSLGEKSLMEACSECIRLEHDTSASETKESYRRPLQSRVASGSALPVKVEEVTKDEGYMVRLRCSTLYDEFGFSKPEVIRESAKISSGDRLASTPIAKDGGRYRMERKPEDVVHSPVVSVKEVDESRVVLDVYKMSLGGEFTTWTFNWSTSRDAEGVYIGEGAEMVLDETVQNRTAEKAMSALENPQTNPVYQDICSLMEEEGKFMRSDIVDDRAVEEYADRVKSADSLNTPNEKQMEFIQETESKITVLQGPPGTGKTSGALSHSILSKVHSINDFRPSCVVTATSNTAIDETMEKVSRLERRHSKKARLIRLVLDEKEEKFDNVEYLDYNDKDDVETLETLLTTRSVTDTQAPPLVIFGTGSRVQKLISNFNCTSSMQDGYSHGFFDMMAVDEASMMPIWELFMSSGFLKQDYNLLVSGDHRQMPPVQKHDWKNESRRTISENLPYLSFLNYIRELRGEDVDANYHQPLGTNCDIPITRLEKTYRCHQMVARFLSRSVYQKDNINYHSNQKGTVELETDEAHLKALSNSPLSVITHSESDSGQSNQLEAHIVEEIVSSVPDHKSVGVVVPHNSQKGLISSKIDRTVDTVERFQGGERDVIILSATVSDPEYLRSEEDFILSPNRLTVALSRMKEMLVVIASENVFSLMPSKPDKYERATVWKNLSSSMCQPENKTFSGPVSPEEEITIFSL